MPSLFLLPKRICGKAAATERAMAGYCRGDAKACLPPSEFWEIQGDKIAKARNLPLPERVVLVDAKPAMTLRLVFKSIKELEEEAGAASKAWGLRGRWEDKVHAKTVMVHDQGCIPHMLNYT